MHHYVGVITVENSDQTTGVVTVQMRDNHRVETAVAWGKTLTQSGQCHLRIGTAVNQYLSPAWRHQQDRITLPDIEHVHVEMTVRPRRRHLTEHQYDSQNDDRRHADQETGNPARMPPGAAPPTRNDPAHPT